MKTFKTFTNTDKAKLLHDLFPEEIPALLNEIQRVCAEFQKHKEKYAKDWDFGLMTFEMWLYLSEQANEIITRYRFNMVRSSRVFADQLCFTHAVLFINDRIIKYAEGVSKNEAFKLAVKMLYSTNI